MLETIREYSAASLARHPDFARAAHRAHAEHYVSMAIALRPELASRSRDHALDRLTADLENLKLAWSYCVDARGLDQLNELLDTMWTLYDSRGWYSGVIDLASDLLSVLGEQPESPERFREEIALQMSLARALMAIRGYTAEVEERFNRALALADEAGGGVPQRFPVLRSLASLYVLRSEYDKGAEVGRELLTLAAGQDDPLLDMEAHYVLGSNLVLLNDFENGLVHLDHAIDLFDPDRVPSDRFRLGPNPAIVSYTTSAFAKWWLGFPMQAVDRAALAVSAAEDLGHPSSLAYAHHHAGLLHMWRQDFPAVAEHAASVLQVANAHDYPMWRSLGMIANGICRVASDEVEAGLDEVERGIDMYEALETPPAFLAGLYFLRVVANLLAGRADKAVEYGGEAMYDTPGEETENPLGAQAYVLLGDALLAVDPPLADDAARAFETAYEISRRLNTHMPQLQAATRLAEMSVGTDHQDQAHDRLLHTYERFTEGFDEVDLVRARSVITSMPS
jgi:tetratricopeptide (TPR) repeat protein